MSQTASNLAYLVTIICFILALRFLSSPTTARRGNWIGAVGMAVAIAVTLANSRVDSYWRIVVGSLIGGVFGAVAARRVRMTAMPQMVALFNGVGGGAAALVSLAEFHNNAPDPGRLHGDVSVAIIEPANETHPMVAEATIATDTSPCSRPGSGALLWNSASETSAAAPPPTPLNSATICGIAVIFTLRAATAPKTPPIRQPSAIRQ